MAHTLQNRFAFGLDTARDATRSARKPRFDPFGLISGFKAFLVYSDLSDRSDAQLAAMGIDRADIVQIAMTDAQRR